MKKNILYLFLCLPFLFVSCSESEEEEVGDVESVVGTWGFASCTSSVETSGSYSLVLNPLLQVALQSYTESNEPTYYVFDESGVFEAYIVVEDAPSLSGSGTYTFIDNILTLAYSEDSLNEVFEVLTADATTLKIRKDYSDSIVYWGGNLLGEYAGSSLTKATSTMTYTIQ